MSSQIFLYIELQGRAITGEGSTAGYEDEIEVESFSFDLGEESPESKKKAEDAHNQAVIDARNKGLAAPIKADTAGNTLSITKFYDKASTNLARYLASNTTFDEARLTVDHHALTGTGSKANPALTIHLFDGKITNVSLSLSDSDKSAKLMETVKLSYQKIEVVYYKSSREDRTARGTDFVFSYDLRTRTA